MIDIHHARALHEERQRQIARLGRRAERTHAVRRPHATSQAGTIRRSLGRSLIRVGSAIASEPRHGATHEPRQPVASP